MRTESSSQKETPANVFALVANLLGRAGARFPAGLVFALVNFRTRAASAKRAENYFRHQTNAHASVWGQSLAPASAQRERVLMSSAGTVLIPLRARSAALLFQHPQRRRSKTLARTCFARRQPLAALNTTAGQSASSGMAISAPTPQL